MNTNQDLRPTLDVPYLTMVPDNYIHAGENMTCSNCGNESTTYGDWQEDEDGFHGVFLCVECGHEGVI